jgi:hypothetical protein
MLSTNTITHSLQVEAEYKKILKSVTTIKHLVKEQYNLDWEDFGKVQAPEGMALTDAYCKDITDRLNIWCEIDRLIDLMGDQVALIRRTEKKLLERGDKKDA